MSRAVSLTMVRGMIVSSHGMVASRHRTMAAHPDPLMSLKQQWPAPSAPRPIVVIGAGSIVRDAHLPVYARLGFPVAGIFDVNLAAARERAAQFHLPRVYRSLEAAMEADDAVFDLAVPPGQIAGVLEKIPAGSAVLIQKPMGRDLADARRILALCRERKLTAAVNFQLRFAPNMIALRHAAARGLFGEFTVVDAPTAVKTRANCMALLIAWKRVEEQK